MTDRFQQLLLDAGPAISELLRTTRPRPGSHAAMVVRPPPVAQMLTVDAFLKSVPALESDLAAFRDDDSRIAVVLIVDGDMRVVPMEVPTAPLRAVT